MTGRKVLFIVSTKKRETTTTLERKGGDATKRGRDAEPLLAAHPGRRYTTRTTGEKGSSFCAPKKKGGLAVWL